jgi:outer membrane scaffolding protein for murein synthesis (MipA/OmpV family)
MHEGNSTGASIVTHLFMRLPLRRIAVGLCACALAAAAAADDAQPEADAWEGSIGIKLNHGPEYPGAARKALGASPVFFLRWGRLSITNSGGFVTRRSKTDVASGLALELVQDDTLRVNASLHIDRGRREDSSAALAGTGNVHATLRARLGGQWTLAPQWRLGAAWNLDALGRGGGSLVDTFASWEHAASGSALWRLDGRLSLADARYMQTYYGVTEAQAASSGYAVYTPPAGLRDVALAASLRFDLTSRWNALVGLGVSRQLGPAAASPLTFDATAWSASAGAAWRF